MKRTLYAFFSVFGLLFQMGMTGGPTLLAQAKSKAAQAKPKATQAMTSQDILQQEVTVTVKLVQAYVTNSKGNPARDLEMSDFVLYDNGKLQAITGFEKHFLSTPKLAPETEVGESKPLPARDTSSLMNRKLVFLFDNERNDLEGMSKSTTAALQFMDEQVQPTDEIALLSYSPIRGMTLHEYFTSDHRRVREAITKIRDLPGIGREGMNSISSDHEPAGMELLDQKIFAQHGGVRAPRPGGAREFILRLTDLAKTFRHIPGQKNVILFTKGFGRRILDLGSYDRPFFMEMSKELASANSPVFSVNTATGMEKIAPPETSLEYLSKQTGGKYFDNVNSYSKNAADIQNATGNYYVLSYSVASTWDGKFHDIKVEVKKPGYKVYAQRGYFNPLPFNKLSPMERHLHLLDLALGEKAYFEQHLNFPMVALAFSDKKESNTLLISEIPVQKIREAVGDNTEFISVVFDENRTIVDSKRVEMDWGTIKGEKICQYSAAALAPGRYDCRVVIRNMENGKAAVGACSLELPQPPAAELRPAEFRVFPPLLLISGRSAQYLNVSGQDKAGAVKETSLSQVFPFPIQEFAPLIGGLERGAESVCAAVRCAWGKAQIAEVRPEVRFSAWLVPVGSDQKFDLTMNLLGTADRDNVRVYLLEFELPDLPPGGYVLHVLGEDPATKTTSETSSALSIVPPAGPEK